MEFYKNRLAELELEVGQTAIIGVRPINSTETASIILAEKFEGGINADEPSELMFMEDHSAFDTKPQLHWINSTVKGAKKLGDEVAQAVAKAIESGEYQTLNVLNPTVGDHRLRLEIKETIVPNDYQFDNVESRAKQYSDQEGTHFLAKKSGDKQYAIFRNMKTFHPEINGYEKPQHEFVQHDVEVDDYMLLDVYQEATPDTSADKALQAQKAGKEIVEQEPTGQVQQPA